jgi:hypothetical protein
MKCAAMMLLIIGLMQIAGDLFRFPLLKAFGAATAISPAPKVFCAVRGLETYSTHFYVEWMDKDGISRSLPLTSEVYSRLTGPYNRRNVYGAALAYGPMYMALRWLMVLCLPPTPERSLCTMPL